MLAETGELCLQGLILFLGNFGLFFGLAAGGGFGCGLFFGLAAGSGFGCGLFFGLAAGGGFGCGPFFGLAAGGGFSFEPGGCFRVAGNDIVCVDFVEGQVLQVGQIEQVGAPELETGQIPANG